MTRLRILHIISGLETGGAETSLARLVLATSADVEHVVVSLTGMGTQGRLLTDAGVRVHALDWNRGSISLAGLRKLIDIVRELSPDVIQGWMYHANIIAAIVAVACGKRRALVWSVRHSLDDWSNESRKLRLIVRANAWMSRLPASILFNSERSRAQHIALGFAGRGATTIANGIDTSRFAPDTAMRRQIRHSLGIAEGAPVVGMVGRVHPLKGHALFLDTVNELRKHVPGLRVVLAGRGTDAESGVVAERIEKLGLRDIVCCLGDRHDVEAIYNACNVTVLASSSEAFPNTVAESMSCGVPCVVTDVGDAAMIVGSVSDVVPHGYPTALASACISAFNGLAANRAAVSSAARQRIVETFSLERATARYLTVWESVGKSRQRIKVLHVLTASMSLHFLRGQREWFAKRNIELHVACSPGPELDAWRESSPHTAHAVPMRRAVSPFADVVALARLIALIRREKFDVVHAGTPKGGLLGTLAGWFCRVPTRVYHVRGLPLATARGWSRALLSATERVAMTAATRVLAVSHSLRDEMVATRLCRGEDVRIIGAGSSNGVDAQSRFNAASVSTETIDQLRTRYNLQKDSIVIGFVGRFTRDKGIAELLGAWRTVRSMHSHVRLLVVGDSDDTSEETAQLLAALRSDPRVHLHGADWDTPPLYSVMDLLVLPTYREGFPNVLLEAASMGVPVVATAVAGCVDAVEHERTGLIVAAHDAVALAAAMNRYVADTSMRRAHGEAARSRVLARFDRRVIWAGLRELYVTGDVQTTRPQSTTSAARRAA